MGYVLQEHCSDAHTHTHTHTCSHRNTLFMGYVLQEHCNDVHTHTSPVHIVIHYLWVMYYKNTAVMRIHTQTPVHIVIHYLWVMYYKNTAMMRIHTHLSCPHRNKVFMGYALQEHCNDAHTHTPLLSTS